MKHIFLWAIPVFTLCMLIELWVSRHPHLQGYTFKDTVASLSMGVGNLLLKYGTRAGFVWLYFAIYEFRLFELPADAWWVWLLLFVAEDFCYYWYHRCAHEVRILWAAHVNHHSSTHYNLSTALRQSWSAFLLGWIFWVPLLLLGFHPVMIFAAQAWSLLYQFWIHTEAIDRMGPLEWVFNTPSHHRVHHGSNPKYLDRNHAGILIIWDRLFGTFQAEEERPTYGLTKNIRSHNPVVIALHEYAAIARDLWTAKSWRGRLGVLLCPPGWREDRTGKTSAMLRREHRTQR